MLKYALNIPPQKYVMHWKIFVCLCRQTISPIFTFSNTVHAISDTNNIYKFQDVWKTFRRVKMCTDKWTDIERDEPMHKNFSTL